MTTNAKHTPRVDEAKMRDPLDGVLGARAQQFARDLDECRKINDALVAALTDLVCLNSCGLYGEIPEQWPAQTRQVIEAARAALKLARGES